MRKFVLLVVISFIAVFLVGCQENVIKLYIWGEYIDSEVLDEFTETTGTRVKLVLFDSNEVAVTQIENASFDVAIPSDYAIEQLSSEKLLLELDWSRIFDAPKEEIYNDAILGIFDYLKLGGFDISKYAAPYFCGSVSLIYNTETVKLEDLKKENWNILSDNQYKVSIYDSSRDAFMAAEKHLGLSVNTENPSDLDRAYNYLKEIKHENTSYKVDQILDEMLGVPVHDIAMVYSGDGIYLLGENDLLAMYVPENGTDVWLDGMVIPKNAKNIDGAYELISFLSSFDSMKANSEYVGYTSPRKDVDEDLTSENGAFKDYKEFYNLRFNELDEIYRYLPEGKPIMDNLWNQLRAYEPYKDYSISFYFFGFLALLIGGFYLIYYKKLRKNSQSID